MNAARPAFTSLQQQTNELLSFRQMEKRVFDAQLGFNMLARYGEDAPEALRAVEHRIEKHLASLLVLRKNVPMPSLATDPGSGVSRVQLVVLGRAGTAARSARNRRVYRIPHIEVRWAEFDAPTNVGAAGQSGLIAGELRPDRNDPRGVWIWAVADNFRLLVDNAMDVARVMLPGSAFVTAACSCVVALLLSWLWLSRFGPVRISCRSTSRRSRFPVRQYHRTLSADGPNAATPSRANLSPARGIRSSLTKTRPMPS